MTERLNLLGLEPATLAELMARWGHKPFRAKQLSRWMHQRGVADFDQMTDLAKDFRAQLQERSCISVPPVITRQVSTDGTRKWLFDVGNNNAIETVFIPEDDRGTLCISSQAGCTLACRFCSTGHQGFNRNLTTAEIIGQLWHARDEIMADRGAARLQADGQTRSANLEQDERIISNVVMMGMGEPLLNYAEVVPALKLMLDDNAYGLSRRRVTVSTSGIVPLIDKLAQDCPVALAVSLHAPNNELRDQLMPINKKFPIDQLMDACARYLEFAPRDFITFEYIMLDGVNDRDEHAHQLIELSKRVRCKMNLIPFNPFPESGLHRSSNNQVKRFASILSDAGVITTVRKTRGDDIDAACGQLAGDVIDRARIREKMQERKTIPIKEMKS
mgnify:FL=1